MPRNMSEDRVIKTGKSQRKIAANLEYLNSDEGVAWIKSDSSIVKALSNVSLRRQDRTGQGRTGATIVAYTAIH